MPAGMDLGTLSVSLSANLTQFTQKIAKVQTQLKGLNASFNKLSKGVKQSSSVSVKGFDEFAKKTGGQLQGLSTRITALRKSVETNLGKGIPKATQKGKKAFTQFKQHGVAEMFSLQSFMKKIVHYITFSIGVQMVMGLRQGIGSLIDTFEDFERSVVDAVAISGYLGSGADDAKDKMTNLAKSLSQDTVYSMNEVAEAFYDIASAGYNVVDMTKGELLPILEYAQATQSDLADATKAVLTTIKAFKLELEDSSMVVDTFTAAITSSFLTMEKLQNAMKYVAPIAGTLGVNLQETVAAVAALTNVGMEGCYDKETRVYTNEGFKYFKDLNGNEKFLSYSLEKDTFEWQTSTEYFEYEVDKPLYRVKNRYIDLLVTDNHNMVVSGMNDKNFRIEKACDVYGKSRRYKLSGNWNGKDPDYFTLPECGYSDKRNRITPETNIPFNLWIKFMALFLSEGHTTYDKNNGDYKIIISQNYNGKAYKEIKSCLDDIPFHYRYDESTRGFVIHSKQLYTYLKQFGKSYDKYIPESIKNASKQSLELFIKYYELGDGAGGRQLYTSSIKMRDDLVEIIMKTNRAASFHISTNSGDKHYSKDRGWIEAKYDGWCIGINTHHTTPLISKDNYTKWHKRRYEKSLGKSIIEDWVPYKGKVYCVTVPNHTLVVERHGKIVICGNSQAGQRLNMVLTKLLKPTEKAKSMLEGMGLSMAQLDPNTYSLVEILYKLQAANFGAAEAAQMFRARTAGAATVVVESADAIARAATQYRLMENITHSVAEVQEATLWGAFTKAKNAFVETANVIGSQLSPVLIEMTSSLTSFGQMILNAFGPTMTSLVSGFKDTFNSIRPILQGLIGVISGFVNILGMLAPALKVLLPLMISYYTVTKAIKVIMWLLSKGILFYNKVMTISGKITKFLLSLKLKYLVAQSKGIAAVIADTVAQLKNTASKAANAATTGTLTAATSSLTAALLKCPLTWFAIAVGAVIAGIVMFASSTREAEGSLSKTTKELLSFGKQVGNVDTNMIKASDNVNRFMELIKSTHDATRQSASGVNLLTKSLMSNKIVKGSTYYLKLQDSLKEFGMTVEEFIPTYNKIIKSMGDDAGGLKGDMLFGDLSQETQNIISGIIRDSVGLTKATLNLSDEYTVYKATANELVDALEDEERILQELDKAKENDAENTRKLIQLNTEYVEARERTTNAETAWLSSVKGVLTNMRSYYETLGTTEDGQEKAKGTLDEWIDVLEESSQAQYDLTSRQEQVNNLMDEQANLTLELSEAISTYGADSEEAAEAQNRLNNSIKTHSSLLLEIGDLQDQVTASSELMNAVIGDTISEDKKLTLTERMMLESARDLIKFRDEYITKQQEYLKWEAKQNALDNIRENHLTVMEEKLRAYLEAQQKIFDIEEKLYKLRADADDQAEELFEKLAEQGLISEDVVDKFKDMKNAQGEALSLQNKFTESYDSLTKPQQEAVEAFMETEKGTAAYGEALQNLMGLGVGGEDLQVFIAYNDAMDNLEGTTEDLTSTLLPLVEALKDMGIINSETAKTFYDMIDNANETATYNFDLAEAYDAVSESISGMIGNTATLANSLIGLNGNTEDVDDVFLDLIDRMGITESEITSSVGNWQNLSDEQLVVAATLIKIYKSLGLYEEGMSIATIAAELGIESLQDLNNTALVSLDSFEEYGEIAEIVEALGKEIDELTSSMEGFIDQLTLFMTLGSDSGDIMWNFSLEGDFDTLLEKGFMGDLGQLLSYAEQKGYSTELLFDTDWDGEDWKSFIGSLDSDKKKQIQDAIEDAGGSFNLFGTWNGEEFDEWFDGLGDKRGEIEGVLDSVVAQVKFESQWDDLDYSTWYANLSTSKKTTIQNLVRALGGKFNNLSQWDNYNWTSFLKSLSVDKKNMLQSVLDAWNLTYDIKANIESPDTKTISKTVKETEDKIITTEKKVKGTEIGQRTAVTQRTTVDKKTGEITQSGEANRIVEHPGIKPIQEVKEDKNILSSIVEGTTKLAADVVSGVAGAIGGIFGGLRLFQHGGVVRGPTMGLMGEKGPEMIVPLSPRYKDERNALLSKVVPDYFKDRAFAEGGVVSPSRNISYGVGDTNTEEYNILGPVSVNANNPIEFGKEISNYLRRKERTRI